MKQLSGASKKILISASGIVLLLIFIIAAYRMFSFAAGRFGTNFYYPYLTTLRPANSELADRSLLEWSKKSLALKVEELQKSAAKYRFDAEHLRRENIDLRRKLDLPVPPPWRAETAEIILRDPLREKQSFTINKGYIHSIAVGDAVVHVHPDGTFEFIGVVDACAARTARVMTVYDPRLRLSGECNGQIGFINSGNAIELSGLVRFGQLPRITAQNALHEQREEKINYRSGTPVLTTGYERAIPRNMRIGTLVVDATGSPGEFETAADYNCHLKPAADPGKLSFVTVLSRHNSNR